MSPRRAFRCPSAPAASPEGARAAGSYLHPRCRRLAAPRRGAGRCPSAPAAWRCPGPDTPRSSAPPRCPARAGRAPAAAAASARSFRETKSKRAGAPGGRRAAGAAPRAVFPSRPPGPCPRHTRGLPLRPGRKFGSRRCPLAGPGRPVTGTEQRRWQQQSPPTPRVPVGSPVSPLPTRSTVPGRPAGRRSEEASVSPGRGQLPCPLSPSSPRRPPPTSAGPRPAPRAPAAGTRGRPSPALQAAEGRERPRRGRGERGSGAAASAVRRGGCGGVCSAPCGFPSAPHASLGAFGAGSRARGSPAHGGGLRVPGGAPLAGGAPGACGGGGRWGAEGAGRALLSRRPARPPPRSAAAGRDRSPAVALRPDLRRALSRCPAL